MTELTRFPWEPELQDPKDLTPFVERVEKLEDICGVKIGGICAFFEEAASDGRQRVKVLAEVSSFLGHVLSDTITVQCIAYSETGQVIGQTEERLYQDSYRGLWGLEIAVYCRGIPARFVLFPRM